MNRVEVEIVVGGADDRVDVDIDEADDLDELDDLVVQALTRESNPLVLDLRSSGRPSIALGAALDRAVLRATRAQVGLRCLVGSEAIAQRLRSMVRSPRSARWRTGGIEVELLTGDIVTVAAEAIVNASNVRLELGAGVSGALRRACGPGLQAEMSSLAPIDAGGLAVTGSHGLAPVSRILHVATASGGAPIVRTALRNVLEYAEQQALETVAIPALGAGTGGVPIEACAALFRDALAEHGARAVHPRVVRVVLWSNADYDAFMAALGNDARFAIG